MAIIMRTLRIMASIGIVLRFICAAVPNLANAEDDEERVVTAEERAARRARQSPIPLQAAVCDIVGIGTVTGISTNAWGEVAHLDVENYWIGNPGSNTLSVSGNKLFLPVTSTSIVFFATSYTLPHYYYQMGTVAQLDLLFKMPVYRQSRAPEAPRFYDSDRSWLHVTTENSALVAFASNLVQAAQISTNRLTFYELIRDGYRLQPPGTRIHTDCDVTFIGCRHWMPTNFMEEVWSDPLLPDGPRADVNNSFMLRTGHWLP